MSLLATTSKAVKVVRIRAHKEIVVEKDPLILKLDNAIAAILRKCYLNK